MNVKVVTVNPYDSLVKAHELLRTYEIRHLLVTEDGELKGVISDRDILRVADLDSFGVIQTPRITIEQVMTPAPVTITRDTTVSEMCKLMAHHHIDCLPVMSGDKLEGLVTSYDLLKLLEESDQTTRYKDLPLEFTIQGDAHLRA